jgi:hypothetical protein
MESINYIRASFKSSNGWLYIMIFFVWSYPLLGLANALFLRVPGLQMIAPSIQNILLIFSIVLSAKAFIGKLKFFDAFFYFSTCFVYILQYVLFPQNEKYLYNDNFRVLITVVPFYFFGVILDHTKLKKLLFVGSCAMILFRIYHDVFFVNDFIGNLDGGGHESAMWQSYTTLPYVLYVWWYMLGRVNLLAIFFSMLGLFLIISYGNRGSLVCLISFISLYLLFFIQYKRRWLAYCLIFIISSVILYFSTEIILALNSWVEVLGMSTRLFDKFLDSDFLYTDDRDVLIDRLKPHMDNMGFWGFGIDGAFPIIGIYPHKIHYDLWVSFGYCIGTLIMLVLIYLPIKVFLSTNNKETKQLLLLFVILGIEPLFFSFSYIIWPYFFLFIGFCVGRIRKTELNPIV